MRLAFCVTLLAILSAGFLPAQTTQGLITGRMLDGRSGKPIAGALVTCVQDGTGTENTARTDAGGYFTLPLLSPGQYSIRGESPEYQAQQAFGLELPVAGSMEINFRLRPVSDIWESGLYRSVLLPGSKVVVTFYGPDVDSSHSVNVEDLSGRQGAFEATVSDVIDPVELQNLPLGGRNVYAMLFTLPSVTTDGSATRGLGLSANGQRPTSTNYLLDGVENNNYLVTGPMTPIAPEAIQEYRVSVSNFSAQYGRTAGFVSNAVTKAGTPQWHGVGYFYFRNEALDANSFQRNRTAFDRVHNREFRPGFQAGGPVVRDRLFVSAAFESFSGRTRQDPQTFWLPTPALTAALPASSVAADLLKQFPSPVTGPSTGCTLANGVGCITPTVIQAPLTIDQTLALVRLDYTSPNGAHHLTGRATRMSIGRPDFWWSPYEDFEMNSDQLSIGSMVSHQWTISPGLVNEARAGYDIDDTNWGTVGNQVPSLQLSVPVTGAGRVSVSMPGASPVYPYANNSRTTELMDNLVWTRGRHVLTVGGGILIRRLSGFFAPQGNGRYVFSSLSRLAAGTPDSLQVPLDRIDPSSLSLPSFDSRYSNNQYYLFAQEAFRVTSRLSLNLGLRYESFGAPKSTGTPDPVLVLGQGNDLLARLQSSHVDFTGGPSKQAYDADHMNFAPRFGFSLSLTNRTMLHGGYGIFYDRLFDNLWQTMRTNRLVSGQVLFSGASVDFSEPIASVLPDYTRFRTLTSSTPNLTMFEPGLRTGYAQHIFLGIEQKISRSLTLNVNGMSALGRRLITNDTLGYNFLLDGSQPGVSPGQLVTYRGSQGTSDYFGLAIKAQYRSGRGLLQSSYTWSHSIDNQSDPIGLDLSDLGFSTASLLPAVPAHLIAGFADPMNSSGDRGNSDFDQRHNLVLLGAYDIAPIRGQKLVEALSQGWTISGVASFRSGFPYTVYTLGGLKGFTRANIVDPALTRANGEPVAGGVQLLNLAGFSGPGTGVPSGRNAFTGPGLRNFDLSLARAFHVKGLPEGSSLIIRADAFNVLNHANLNNPYPVLTTGFGVATYGRSGRPLSFPTAVPLGETPRQFLMSIRVRF